MHHSFSTYTFCQLGDINEFQSLNLVAKLIYFLSERNLKVKKINRRRGQIYLRYRLCKYSCCMYVHINYQDIFRLYSMRNENNLAFLVFCRLTFLFFMVILCKFWKSYTDVYILTYTTVIKHCKPPDCM